MFFHNHFYYVVTEYCEGGPVISIAKKGKFSPAVISEIMKQLLSAVSYLHELGIAHRDIKLENMVLLKKKDNYLDIEDLTIKLIDFGLATPCKKHQTQKTGMTGTLEYMAPEIIKQGIFN